MNWLPLNLVLIKRPMFCVCDRSSAASTSSRMYMGAGEYWRSARIRERAISDLCRKIWIVSNRKLNGMQKTRANGIHKSCDEIALPLTTAKLSQTLLPYFSQANLDF